MTFSQIPDKTSALIWRHELFPNEVILNVIIPNIKMPTFSGILDIYPEFRISILTGRASFGLTNLRGKGTKLGERERY